MILMGECAWFWCNSNFQGLCYALWLDPSKVPDVAEDVMADAGQTFPLLLANRVRAQCCDRMGRRFDSIMKRTPQVLLLSKLYCVSMIMLLRFLNCQSLTTIHWWGVTKEFVPTCGNAPRLMLMPCSSILIKVHNRQLYLLMIRRLLV